jgi:hypothetical protein
MKRIQPYQINCLVNLTVKSKTGNVNTMSGYISTVGKEYILFLDQDGIEHPFRKSCIIEIKQIQNENPKST